MRLYRQSCGLCDMGIELDEGELPGDVEYDGADGLEAAVASGAALGRLEQPVEGLDEAVGAARSGPGCDSVDVIPDRPGDGLHGLVLGAVHVGAIGRA